jgi:hypothetical protein
MTSALVVLFYGIIALIGAFSAVCLIQAIHMGKK